MQNLPITMRSLIHNQTTKRLALDNSAALPKPGANEYLVKVHATAFCSGELDWPRPEEMNESTPGQEASGVIETAPPGSRYQIGQRIYWRTDFPRAGSAREYSIANEQEVALVPPNISASEAAAAPLSALTAWQALFIQARLKADFAPKSRSEHKEPVQVFVNGASGGVGLWTVQLARAAGFEVVGTSTNTKLVQELGANEVINYKETSISQWLAQHPNKRFDLVLDCVGGSSLGEAWHAAKEEGLVLTIVAPEDMSFKEDIVRPRGISETVRGKFFIVETNGVQLGKISQLIEAGRVRPVVDSVYRLEDYEEAMKRTYSGRAVGKVVVELQSWS